MSAKSSFQMVYRQICLSKRVNGKKEKPQALARAFLMSISKFS
jgi:hypothetical protein